MSFLEQVITSAGEAEVDDIKCKVHLIRNKMAAMDVEVKEYLETNYIKFAPLLRDNRLEIRAKSLFEEMNQLQIRIQNQEKCDLDDSVNGLKKLITSLEEVNFTLIIIKNLLAIDSNIKNSEDDQHQKRYLEAAKKVKFVEDALHNNSDLKNLNVYKPVLLNLTFLKEKFLNESLEVWNTFITWNEYEKQQNKIRHLTLKIDNTGTKSEIVQVLHLYDYLDFEIKVLSNKLLKQILEPVIDCTSHVETNENGIFILEIDFYLNPEKQKPTCINVISALSKVFNFLSYSLHISINDSEIFIEKLSELIESEFCEYFINKCLSEAIPTNQEEFSQFSNTVEEVLNFDRQLKERGIVQSSNTKILNYTKNIDSLFAAKTCQQYLVEARKIFLQNLHNMVKIEPKQQTPVPADLTTDTLEDSDLELCKNSFQFPACYISQSTEQILLLIHRILDEMIRSTNLCAVELCYTARNIVSLYCDLVPLEHKNLLSNIPQHSALFCNNCMYLAHELALLGSEYSNVLKNNIVTFVDFVEPLRSLGHSALNDQVDKQREQLVEILRQSGLRSLHTTDFPPSIEKSFRQCLRQLSLLQDVWKHVLPAATYSKTMGSLCNTFLDTVIDDVVSIEDIPIDTASQLTNVFSVILDKVPGLLSEPKEVHRHIKRWQKFTELIKILNGSLKDIDDRWADGKGPLAQEFSVEDIKHLIRALFQNTNNRASLLSRLR